MNKESIIAIVLGLLLGAFVALGSVYITVKKQREQNTKIQKSATESAILDTIRVPTVVSVATLEIASPTSGYKTSAKNVVIKGTTSKGALLLVQSPIKTYTEKATGEAFSIDFPLALGENVIALYAYHKGTATPVKKQLYIYRL